MKRPHRTLIAILFLTAAFTTQAGDSTPQQQAIHILNRLAYGPRPGDIEHVMQIGVDRYIELQLNPSAIALPAALTQQLDSLAIEKQTAGEALSEFLSVRNAAQSGDDAARQMRREIVAAIVGQTAQARIARAVESPRQLEEIMVDFWFNHFNVFAGKGLDRALVASYERDAIRPYALGSFRDLLGASARHPAMLFYLDNWLSSTANYQPDALRKLPAQGPRAKATGLNENYARELMELHTLGVDGGYTQKDVTELARMLTGWTFQPRQLARSNAGFRFDAARHDWGDKQWLGRHISAQGQQEGEMALDILAMHPATAHHLSYKLAQYFVQDAPPPALVDRLAQRYLESRGDIRSVLRTLFFSPEFRAASATGAKFKTPYRFIISALRAADLHVVNVRPLLATLNQLGMPLYGCQTPDGYRDTESAWLNPDALARRIAFAGALASGRLPLAMPPDPGQRMGWPPLNRQAGPVAASMADSPPLDAERLLQTLGAGISPRTRETIADNPPRLRAAMILGSPDFMRH